MALNLDAFLTPQWKFKTPTNEWNVYFYSTNAAIMVEKHFSDGKTKPEELVRKLIGEICARGKPKDGEDRVEGDITPEALEGLSKDDIDSFAGQFLANDSHAKERSKEVNREEFETDVEYLLRVLQAETKAQTEKTAKIFEEMTKGVSGLFDSPNLGIRNVAKDLANQNEGLFNAYGSRMIASEPMNFPTIEHIPNPVHETNNQLEDMNQRLDNLIGFGEKALGIMNGLQVASAQFLDKFSEEAHNNSKAAGKAIFVGFLAVVLSIGQIVYTEFWRVPQDGEAMNAALTDIRTEMDEMQSLQTTTAQDIAAAVGMSDGTDAALLERIEKLLLDQATMNQATVEALEAIATALSN